MKMLSLSEMSRNCKKTNIIGLLSRDDEENTTYAIELCKHMNEIGCENILYFSLKESIGNLQKKYSELPVEIDDTEGLDIEALEVRVREHMYNKSIDMIVIDYFMLISSKSIQATRQAEIVDIVCRLKCLAKEIGVFIVILIPLSKYVPMDYLIMQEINQYGDIKSMLDVIDYVHSSECESPFQMLKDEVYVLLDVTV